MCQLQGGRGIIPTKMITFPVDTTIGIRAAIPNSFPTFSIVFWGENAERTAVCDRALAEITIRKNDIHVDHSDEEDSKKDAPTTVVEWKKDFLRLKEVIGVLRKFQCVDDNNKVTFEINLVLNSRLVRRLFFSLPKDDAAVKGHVYVAPSLEVECSSEPIFVEISDVDF